MDTRGPLPLVVVALLLAIVGLLAGVPGRGGIVLLIAALVGIAAGERWWRQERAAKPDDH